MKDSVLEKACRFLKEHIFVLVYFTFFFLASLSATIMAFKRIELYYKAGVFLALAITMAIIMFRRKIKPNFKPIIFVASIFVSYSLYYIILPKYYSFISPDFSYIGGTQVTIPITFSLRINSIVNIFTICFFICLFVFISPYLGLTKKDFLLFNILYISYLLIACIYSIKDILSGSWLNDGVESFFHNKNTFGFFLMVGVFLSFLSSSFISKYFIKIFFYLFGIIFFAFSVLSKSSTSMILSAFLLVFSLFNIVVDSKLLNRPAKIIVSSLISLLVLMIVFSPFIPFLSSTFIGEYVKRIVDKISNAGKEGFESLFTSRGKLWMLGVHFMSSHFIWLGYGIPILERMTYLSNVSYFTTNVLTNSYLTVLDGLGIVGGLFYLGLFVFLLIVYFKDKGELSGWMIFMLFAYLVYGVFESLVLFGSTLNSLLLTPVLAIPAMVMTKNHFKISFLRIKVIDNEQN